MAVEAFGGVGEEELGIPLDEKGTGDPLGEI